MVKVLSGPRPDDKRMDVGSVLSGAEQKMLVDGLKNRRTPHIGTLIPMTVADRHEID